MISRFPRYHGLIFDIDGTLLDSRDVIIYSLADTIREIMGVELNPDEMDWVLGCPGAVTLQKLGCPDPEHGVRQWYENYADHEERLDFFPGMEEVLRDLKRHFPRMAVVTNNLRFKYKLLEHRFDLKRFFDVAFCVDDVARPKPWPDPMLAVCEQWGLPPGQAVYVGDSANDLHSAQSAGTDFICAGWGAWDREFFEQRQVPIMDDPMDLLRLLRS
ncbi:HAD family hydrolase [Desulfurispira natronophila]|uniref:HAD superfamily hydrolase (TIGR01549 family) n=1 Tax=Desulfurispira natronophila TaxID=682562 RepID=A0A7W8DGP3_9BACT|nr:HAD family hydrolase [Desulfurispira natronophila]MBB5021630.1 HAD superfamily hydrolase (TIGR01549 family) [Desulfurispira natronophila]